MSDQMIFGNFDSSQYDVECFAALADNAPARDYDTIRIPGRSGDLLLDKKSYQNQTVLYSFVTVGDSERTAVEKVEEIRNAIMSQAGYQRLEDSIHEDEFYLACYKNAFVTLFSAGKDMAKMALEFSRKPQRFLKSGESFTEITTSRTFVNPTLFASRPLIRIYGYGTLQINDESITVASSIVQNYVDVDCDIMEAYNGTESLNDKITLQGAEFPALAPGNNTIVLPSTINRVLIWPRWWRL